MKGDHGFHRHQSVVALPDAGLEVSIEAKPGERAGLAAHLDVPAVTFVRAKLVLERWRGAGVRVTGTAKAALTQTCIVTLEPIQAVLEAQIDRKFLPITMLETEADPHELLIDPDGEDPPDPLPHALDLGDLVAEEIALNLDPYPRKEGVDASHSEMPESHADNPFAALKGVSKT